MSSPLPAIAILAGGLATRLRPVTEHLPKSLIPVNGRPFIEHQLTLLRASGFQRVVICAGFLGDRIVEAVGDGRAFDLEVAYSFDGPVLLGTGGAVKRALPLLGAAPFFVIYGDSYLECDYRAIHEKFRESGKPALMTVFRNGGRWDTSNVEFSDATIRAYSKLRRTPAMRHIDYGAGVFSPSLLEGMPDGDPLDLSAIYEQLAAAGNLAAFEAKQRFFEIGSHQGIVRLADHLRVREQCL